MNDNPMFSEEERKQILKKAMFLVQEFLDNFDKISDTLEEKERLEFCSLYIHFSFFLLKAFIRNMTNKDLQKMFKKHCVRWLTTEDEDEDENEL